MIFFFHQMYFITLEGVLHKKKTGRATFPFLSSSSTSFDIKTTTTTTKNNKTTGRTKNRSILAFSENHFKNKFFWFYFSGDSANKAINVTVSWPHFLNNFFSIYWYEKSGVYRIVKRRSSGSQKLFVISLFLCQYV